jgi:Sulfotransferase family
MSATRTRGNLAARDVVGTSRQLVLAEPIIILTGARFGSTLVRRILDSHPDLACPPETNISKTCEQLASAWRLVDPESSGSELSSIATSALRAMMNSLFAPYLLRRDKIRWCDKSLGTVRVADELLKIYPKARFICLYRHCMDVIFSGLEASPWGLLGFGFENYAPHHGGNSVAALASYWTDHVGSLLAFEERHPDNCHRIYYEELVQEPRKVVDSMLSFVGAEPDPGITGRIFTRLGAAAGPGDYKIHGTASISGDSVSRGARVPAALIPPPQLQIINFLLGRLGYRKVDESWGRTPCPSFVLERNGARYPAERMSGEQDATLAQLHDIMSERMLAKLADPAIRISDRDGTSRFALVAYTVGGATASCGWRVDGRNRELTRIADPRQLDTDWFVTGEVDTWLDVLAGEVSLPLATKAGELRYVEPAAESHPGRTMAMDALAHQRMAILMRLLGLENNQVELSE